MNQVFFGPELLDFMAQIRFNNNKEFMHSNKQAYQDAMRDPYYRFIEALSETMQKIDPLMETRPNKVLSRIFRDTRFSNNKAPYRDHHWIAFRHQAEPRDQSLMYWFEIRLDAVHWGLGFWGENKSAIDVLRRRIIAKPDEINKVLQLIKAQGFQLSGNAYRRMKVPEGLSDNLRDLYVKKEIYITKDAKDPTIVFSDRLLFTIAEDFKALAPAYRLLRGCYEIGLMENEVNRP